MFLSEALAAIENGKVLQGNRWGSWPGEEVEYAPRKDPVNGHPDAYPWRVKRLGEAARVRSTQIEIR